MGDLVPGRRGRLTRSQRVDRGANLIMASGACAVIFVVAFILALLGVIGSGIPIVAAVASGAFGYGAYRTIKR